MPKNDCWIWRGVCLEKEPEGYYGFTYCITDCNGKKYYGKKAFTHKKTTKLSKRAKALPENKGRRKTVSTKDSGWLKYWGSSKPLLEFINQQGTKGFRREVVKFCKTRQDLSYWEMDLLVREEVLFREDCWNGNILSKFFKGKIEK